MFRFISWFSTSLIYLASGSIPSIPFKIILVFGLLIEGLVAEYLYIIWADDSTGLAALIGAETIGICVLLIPTGGLESPFMWYALNLVFAAASFLPLAWCYATSASFLLSAAFGNYLIDPSFSLSYLLRHKGFIVLLFVSLTIAAQQTARLVRKLSNVCRELEEATEILEGMAHPFTRHLKLAPVKIIHNTWPICLHHTLPYSQVERQDSASYGKTQINQQCQYMMTRRCFLPYSEIYQP